MKVKSNLLFLHLTDRSFLGRDGSTVAYVQSQWLDEDSVPITFSVDSSVVSIVQALKPLELCEVGLSIYMSGKYLKAKVVSVDYLLQEE